MEFQVITFYHTLNENYKEANVRPYSKVFLFKYTLEPFEFI